MHDKQKDMDKTLRARMLVTINDEAGKPRTETAALFRKVAIEFRAKGNREAASLFKRAAQLAEREV